MPEVIEETAVKPELNDAQEKLRHQLGYIGMIAKCDTIYEARNRATEMVERASTPSDAMTAAYMLYNTVVHELAKRCVPLGKDHMSKGELVNLLFGSPNEEGFAIDFTRPQPWDDAVRKLGVNPHEYVWAYSKDVDSPHYMGGPLHLGQEMMERIMGLKE